MTDLAALTHRGVDVAGQDQVQPTAQARPALGWLNIADLIIDDSYQRPLGKSNWVAIRAIAENFRWSHFSPVICAPMPSGMYALIDGQHRVHAAALCGFDQVPAMIVDLSGPEQAAAFAGINGQVTRITLFHVFKAAYAAGEDWAVNATRAVSAADCRLMTANASTAAKRCGEVYAIALIRKLVTDGHGPTVTAVLKALRQIDGDRRAGLYSDFVLRPLLHAVASDRTFLEIDLAAFVRAHDPFKVLDRVRRETGATTSGKAALIHLLRRWQ